MPGDKVEVSDVAVLPVFCEATLDAPEDVPTSTMYDVGEPDAAPHDNATLEPLTAAVRLPGTDGEMHGVGGDDELVKVASFDAALEPPEFAARTRTK